ncbi:popy class I histocompatibility antigen, alpha chain E-like [Clarias gariepinus]
MSGAKHPASSPPGQGYDVTKFKHTLQYIYTGVTPGINFPEFTAVGQLNGQQFDYYDSKIREMIPKTEWIEKNVGKDYWDSETWKMRDAQETFRVSMGILTQCFNKTEGVHTWQRMYGCEFDDDDDDTTIGYEQYAYDGEDYISFDLKTLTWTTSTHPTVTTKYTRDGVALNNDHVKNYLENVCIEWLKKYVSHYKETQRNKVVPEVSVFHKHSPFPEVVCHATGFFHKPLNITWQKDGEDVHENMELRETLPNQDGSFQRRSILKVPAEELQKHTYTCVVQHSSLEKELVLNVSQCRILTGFEPFPISPCK